MNSKAGSKHKQLFIAFNPQKHGWVVMGAPGRPIVFATEMDAENFCIYQLHQCSRPSVPKLEYQDLPHRSVWTGAPWDHRPRILNRRHTLQIFIIIGSHMLKTLGCFDCNLS